MTFVHHTLIVSVVYRFPPDRSWETRVRRRDRKCSVSAIRTVRWARWAAAATWTRTAAMRKKDFVAARTDAAAELLPRAARESPAAAVRPRPNCRPSWNGTQESSNGCGIAGRRTTRNARRQRRRPRENRDYIPHTPSQPVRSKPGRRT